jgi:hypothetical protein
MPPEWAMLGGFGIGRWQAIGLDGDRDLKATWSVRVAA